MRKSRKLPASQKSSRGGRIRRPPEWLLMSGIDKLGREVKMKLGREVKMTGSKSQKVTEERKREMIQRFSCQDHQFGMFLQSRKKSLTMRLW